MPDRRRTNRQWEKLVLVPMLCLAPPAAGALAWWLVWTWRILPGGPLGGWAPMVAAAYATLMALMASIAVYVGYGIGGREKEPPSAGRYVRSLIISAFGAFFAPLWIPPAILFSILFLN